ncbi:MAG: molybdopterin molybdenumtransferase MoeA [Rubrivivax sp.]|nr:MAG: molybdopterin molybdenumtransferase MoeA [Rubrivivax sp.]
MAPPRKPLMPLDDAWARLREAVVAHVSPGCSTETVDSFDALGRVLAEDVVSSVDVPPLDNSAMDGYAIACPDGGVAAGSLWPVGQRIAAGSVGAHLQAGTAARIFTGAPVPEGAEAVVMQEHVELTSPGQSSIRLTHAVERGQNIRRRGEDIAAGQTVLARGAPLTPAALGVAASVGREQLAVFARPRVGVLTTGSELIMPGQPLPPGGIYNSNRHTLRGLVQASGAQSADLGIVPDDLSATRAALRDAALHHDLIITSGGVSVGEEDHLRAAVQAEGGLDFWALALKPGKPFVFGWLARPDGSRALYMGLPGNPVASFVTFLLLVRPVIGVLGGQGWALPATVPMRADFDWPQADQRREFLRARVNDQGGLSLFPHQGSGVLTSAAWADGLVDVPPSQAIAHGDTVAFVPWAQWLHPAG